MNYAYAHVPRLFVKTENNRTPHVSVAWLASDGCSLRIGAASRFIALVNVRLCLTASHISE